jgi:ferredoxin
VEVCPVDCFYEGVNTLVIEPEECIDCGACEPVCPTSAIYEEEEVPEKEKAYIEINAVFSGAKDPSEADTEGWPAHLVEAINSPDFRAWPMINVKREALPDADALQAEEGKIVDFDPHPYES